MLANKSSRIKAQSNDSPAMPAHIAIIMDGNGRWAKRHGLARSQGHRRGVEKVKEIVEEAARLGIKVLTLYAFSTENWKRPRKEVDLLMSLLKIFLAKEISRLKKNNIRFECIGRINELPDSVLKMLARVKKETANNSGLVLNLALNYGSRSEIVDAVNKILRDKASGKLSKESIDEDDFSGYLYTANLPDPDLLIRTSGEERISNFLLWQISYSELVFCDKLWPEFGKKDLLDCIAIYQKRVRRFGGI